MGGEARAVFAEFKRRTLPSPGKRPDAIAYARLIFAEVSPSTDEYVESAMCGAGLGWLDRRLRGARLRHLVRETVEGFVPSFLVTVPRLARFEEVLPEGHLGHAVALGDKTGKLVIAAKFDKAGPFIDGVARVEEKGRPRLIDRSGKDLTPANVDFVGITREGMTRVWRGRAQGFADAQGRLAVPTEYDGAREFHEGLAAVLKGKVYGRVVIPATYSYARPYHGGLAFVLEKGKSLYIDDQGAVVWSKP